MNSNSFKEVSAQVGIEWSRQKGEEAFSVSWLDYNNDGLLDLWVSGHGYNGSTTQYPDGKFPYLYLNNGDGTFTNIFDKDWRQGEGGDVHGTQWADFDNDGDQDLFTAGGGKLGDVGDVDLALLSNNLFVNDNGTLQNEAPERGVENAIARSRSPLWFDGNNDGLLDVVVTTALRDDGLGYTAYFEQQANGTFVDRTVEMGLNVNGSSRYAQLADLTGDGKLDLIIQGTYTWPLGVFDFSSGTGFVEVTNVVPQLSDEPADPTFDFADHTSARDSIVADFNNDGRNEVFLTRSHIFTPEPTIFQGSDTIVSADLILKSGGEIGVSFKTDGVFALDSFDFNGRDASFAGFDATNIFIGAEGRNPTPDELAAIFGSGYDPNLTSGSDACLFCGEDHANSIHGSAAFQLDPNDSTVEGIKSDRSVRGIYVGYDALTSTWEVRVSSTGNELVRIAVESDQTITELTEINFTSANPNSLALSDQFLVYDSATGEYVDMASEVGLGDATLSHSAVTGDFDNDMDLDIYIANAYPSFNQPNILYENQGNGTFIKVEFAGGAVGTEVGPHRLDFEIGQRLAVADYDRDGFLDIFAGSTTGKSPRKTYLGTPNQLFHNEEGVNGNTNNWIQLDLQGIQSNRDAIGARVLITTPDGVTQVREQTGGTHVFAQNTSRLHFGLGNNTNISQIVIEWPSGESTTLNNVGVNQILDVVEAFASIITGDESANNLVGTADKDQIIGLGRDDTLSGNENNDSLQGGDGNDSLIGGNGHDTLYGDNGNDTLDGGDGNDFLEGGDGLDLLNGHDGSDTLNGGNGNDILNGGANSDRLNGGEGNDSLNGGTENDYLQGGVGLDSIFGENGKDTIYGGDDSDFISGGDSNDLIWGESGDDTLNGNNGHDLLDGGDGNDSILGGEGKDTIIGGEGNDYLTGEGGLDSIDGGNGNDTITGDSSNDTLNGGAGSDRLLEFSDSNFLLSDTKLIAKGTDLITGFESARLVGGIGHNLIDAHSVTTMNVILEGGSGNDTMTGGSLNDFLFGANDADSIEGGDGNDTITGGNGNDTLNGGNGSDRLIESNDSDFILTNTQLITKSTDIISGFELARLVGGGSDNLMDAHSVTTMNVILEGGLGNDTLIGSINNDTLNGFNHSDLLEGKDGLDSLIGGSGNDTLIGGLGNDTLIGGEGVDVLIESANSNLILSNTQLTSNVLGIDDLSGLEEVRLTGGVDNNLINGTNASIVKVQFNGLQGNDTLLGGANNDTLFGGEGYDSLKGNNGNDFIDGGDGNDTLIGGVGNDTLIGGNGTDRLIVSINSNLILTDINAIGEGTDVISGFELANVIAGEGNNTLNASGVTNIQVTFNGNGGNDTLIGGAVDDFLIGGAGNDTLIGNGGSDRFMWNNLTESVDTILDFEANNDKLVFSASGFGSDLVANAVITEQQFVLGTSATDTDQRFIYNNTNGNLFFDADGNGSSSQILVAHLNGNPTISSSDIYIKA